MHWRSIFVLPALSLVLAAQAPVQVAVPLPKILDLSQAKTDVLLPVDPRDPAQVDAARRAWMPMVDSVKTEPALRLRLPRDERRLPLLLAASQALKAANPEQRLYLAYDPQAPAIWNEAAWGPLHGGILGPEDLGNDPAKWQGLLAKAQEQLPGRPWILWLPADPGAGASTLLGDGGRLVVPPLGPATQLAAAIPAGFTEIEGGAGDLTLRSRTTGEAKRWRFLNGAWKPAELPKERNMVSVTAQDSYDVQALLAKMRATQVRDHATIQSMEARLDVDLHIQGDRGPGGDLGFTFRSFKLIDDSEEVLQKQVRLNGVKANITGEFQMPVIESRASVSVPVALGLTEHFRYTDGGAAGAGRRRIRFIPVDSDPLNFEGELTVDEATGRVLEERSSRSGLPGIVKSEKRVLIYGEPAPGLWCVVKSDSHERWVMTDGTRQVRRTFVYSEITINGADFTAHRDAARGSKATMMKETVEGMRYFTRQNDGSRKLEEKAKSSGVGLGGGLFMDPNMKPPAFPIAGLAYFDFNALDRGIQVSALTAAVFNMGSVTVPNLFAGVDASARATMMLMPSGNRVVKHGELLDRDVVDRSGGGTQFSLGRDLGLGLRAELSGNLGYTHFKNTQDTDHKTEGFALPPSGWLHGWQGTLEWQRSGFQIKSLYGKITRPDGTYGTATDTQVIPDQGHASYWGGIASLDHQLESKWQFHLEAGHEAGKGFDRFLELSTESNAVGMKALPVSDRADFAQVSVALPPAPNLRLSLALNHTRLRAVPPPLDDGKVYRFTGLTLSGDIPGFWWFTIVRADIHVGLQSDISGLRSVNGMLMFLKFF